MSDYFIQSTKNIVYVSRIIDGELETIKINGDTNFKFTDFWPLFKRKIEYEADEQLAFIVLSDDKLFSIDPEISIADKFMTSDTELHDLISDHLKTSISCLTFPKIDFDIKKFQLPPTVEIISSNPEVNNGSIESYYRKKTREYNRNNVKSHVGK